MQCVVQPDRDAHDGRACKSRGTSTCLVVRVWRLPAMCMLHRCHWVQHGESGEVEKGAGVEMQHHDEGYGLEEATGFSSQFLRLW